MKRVKLDIQPGIGNTFEVYIKAPDEESFYKAVNNLKKQPVHKYDTSKKCSTLSLYYYDKFIASLKGRNYEVTVSERVVKNNEKLRRRIKLPKVSRSITYPTLWNKDYKLFDYQKEAVNAILRRRKFINATEMGLGKSPEAIFITLTAFDWGYDKALVVVPSALKYQWREEILKFSKLNREDVVIVGDKMGCPTGEIKNFNKARKICKACDNYKQCLRIRNRGVTGIRADQIKGDKHKIVIMNYDLMKIHSAHVAQAGFDIYIFDESSKLKNYNTQTTRETKKIIRNSKRDDFVVFMSGTVIENSVIEFFPVFDMLDKNVFGSYSNFKNTYLICDFWGKPIGVRNEKLLKNITNKFLIRHTVAQVWKDRPALFEYDRSCVMHDAQNKIYNDVSESVIEILHNLELENKINTAEVMTQMIYLLMVADSAEVVDDVNNSKPFEMSAKLEMLVNMLTEEFNGQKVVVFCKYANKILKPIIARELKRAKVEYGLITGGTKNKTSIINEFASKEGFNVLLCSDTLSYGANLQMANYLINFDLPWNPAVLDQRIARVYRVGQEKPVTVVNLVTADTIESYVQTTLYSKRKMFNEYIGSGISGTAKKSVDIKFLLEALK